MNPIYTNPASTGETGDIRIGLNYRNHWLRVPGRKFPGPLATYNVYSDFHLGNKVVTGLGLFFLQDIEGEGIMQYNSFGLSYAWAVGDENYYLAFGTKLYYNSL